MKRRFEEILKGIFLSSLGSLIANNEAQPLTYELSTLGDNRITKTDENKFKDNGQKYILTILI